MIELSPLARVRNICISQIYGFCPVQGEGTVKGLPFYFRARADTWIFAVANTPDGDPVQVAIEQAPGFRIQRPYGRKYSHDAGFMSHQRARILIYTTAIYYLNGGNRNADR
jgi:hypothetical protein